jgi:hypothetical protein
MLFRVDFTKTMFEVNPEMEMIEQFKEVPDRSLKYMCLMYDYESPYRKLPLSQRKDKVASMVGFKREKGRRLFDKNARDIMNGKNPKLEEAIKEFKTMIYDTDRETLQSLDVLIENIRTELKTPGKSSGDMKNKSALAKELPALASTKKQLAQILEIQGSGDVDEEEEESKMSTLEMLNQGLL